jgi:predicted DNA-binding transcriptional regulator AlpA
MTEIKRKYKHGIPQGYIGVPTLREWLGKSATTIWKMTLDGRLPKPLKDGKRNVWDEKEIRRWIQYGKFLRKR